MFSEQPVSIVEPQRISNSLQSRELYYCIITYTTYNYL